MPRIRTTPEVIATAHEDRVDFFAVEIAYTEDGDILLARTTFSYAVCASGDTGFQRLRQIKEEIAWPDLPPAAKTLLKDVYQLVLVDAENKGHIGAGTDEGDLP